MTDIEPDTDDDTDQGPGARRAGPERMCIVTRKTGPVTDFIRFVVGPAGDVVPDLKNKLPGRGAWVSGEAAVLAEAIKRKAFARAFKKPVEVSATLVEDTARLLEQAWFDSLGIAIKARLAIPGFAKTENALLGGAVAAVIQAAEAAPDGVRKLAAAGRRGGGTLENPIPVLIFGGSQLDLAFGRANVIHAALLAGPASETLLARYSRLERFRGGEPAKLAEE